MAVLKSVLWARKLVRESDLPILLRPLSKSAEVAAAVSPARGTYILTAATEILKRTMLCLRAADKDEWISGRGSSSRDCTTLLRVKATAGKRGFSYKG